jgi:site-specific DNA-methyltransferase (adenine-specific)
MGRIELLNIDCMEFMKTCKDKQFDLAVVDPPYGSEGIERTGGTWANKIDGGARIKEWDFKPKDEYFKELFRVSENQIVWGGNYFGLPPNRHFLIWKKHIPENFTLAMCEYAWSSFNKNAKIFEFPSNTEKFRFHPTQKPVELYAWILKNYATENQTILDTHLGSGSIAIAIHKANEIDKMNLSFTGCEIDKEYFEASLKRFNNETKQQILQF